MRARESPARSALQHIADRGHKSEDVAHPIHFAGAQIRMVEEHGIEPADALERRRSQRIRFERGLDVGQVARPNSWAATTGRSWNARRSRPRCAAQAPERRPTRRPPPPPLRQNPLAIDIGLRDREQIGVEVDSRCVRPISESGPRLAEVKTIDDVDRHPSARLRSRISMRDSASMIKGFRAQLALQRAQIEIHTLTEKLAAADPDKDIVNGRAPPAAACTSNSIPVCRPSKTDSSTTPSSLTNAAFRLKVASGTPSNKPL